MLDTSAVLMGEGRRKVARGSSCMSACCTENLGRGKGGGSHSPPMVFQGILPTYKAVFDLGCME